jgi:hypothetical protein
MENMTAEQAAQRLISVPMRKGWCRMTYANATERQALISGLRELTDFLESNPEVPAPKYTDVLVFPPHASDTEDRNEIDVIASRIGSRIEISSTHHHYVTSRQFGPVGYRAVAIPSNENKEQ